MSTIDLTVPRLAPDLAGILMSPEEFDAVVDYDDEYRYELVHGVLVVHAIPSAAERNPNEELGRWLRNYREDHPQGSALDATLSEEYIRTGDSRRRADRVIWTGLGRTPDLNSDVPSIVVEFVSPGRRSWRRDYIEKRRDYSAVGVREYWIIDRFARTLTVYHEASRQPAEQCIAEGATYQTSLLPGFELPLAKLLAAADEYGTP